MSEPTAGPWKASVCKLRHGREVKARSLPICMVFSGADGRDTPNARLIAAAPQLLEALGMAAEALALPTSDAGKARALDAVRAAIRAAREG